MDFFFFGARLFPYGWLLGQYQRCTGLNCLYCAAGVKQLGVCPAGDAVDEDITWQVFE